MTTPVQHIYNNLGINLYQEAQFQSRSNLLPKAGIANDRDLQNYPAGLYLESIYDVVVGIYENAANRFDSGERFGVHELMQLAKIVDVMKSREGTTAGQKKVLQNIANATDAYINFLQGNGDVLKKDPVNLGNRHTLMRGEKGNIYEMLNSMTPNEASRFKRTTAKLVDVIENPRQIYKQNGKNYIKIELGSGSFGKTRIAREIKSDCYVAVKKSHPRVLADVVSGFVIEPPFQSRFNALSANKKAAVHSISGAVITPIDERVTDSKVSIRQNRVANIFSVSPPATAEEFIDMLKNNLDLLKAYAALPDVQREAFNLARSMGMCSSGEPNNAKTIYSFSELGVTTVDSLIDKFNVARVYFEGQNDASKLSAEAKDLLTQYSAEYDHAPENVVTDNDRGAFHESAGKSRFNNAAFKLKDPIHNQKFLNTLGKKMIAALAQLHECGLTHHDIKPDNIVICQDERGNVSIKLIDIDLIAEKPERRKLPSIGCLPYMPPEADFPEIDESISYDGQLADTYAMGMTLRKILGFTVSEVVDLSNLVKYKALGKKGEDLEKQGQKFTGKMEVEFEKLWEYFGKGESPLQKSDAFAPQLAMMAVMKKIPKAASLKYMSDLMTHSNNGKRLSMKKALEQPFFNDPGNLLTDAEFSRQLHQIHRFGIKTKADEVVKIYDDSQADPVNNPLREVRQEAIKARVRQRNEELSTAGGEAVALELSDREATKASLTYAMEQGAAGLRRLGRRTSMAILGKPNEAEKKLGYKGRF